VFNGNIYSIVYINTALFSGIVVSIDLFINVCSCQCSEMFMLAVNQKAMWFLCVLEQLFTNENLSYFVYVYLYVK